MSNNKPESYESCSIRDFVKSMPRRTLGLRIRMFLHRLKYPRKTIKSFRGRIGGGIYHHNHSNSQNSTPATFRESQHFDPERAYIERMQERAYFDMVDGKGDPQPCDCDHDR